MMVHVSQRMRLLAFLAVAASFGRATADEGPVRVLFIGNSYSFQVPKVFEALSRSRGRAVVVSQVTNGGWTLRQHAESKETRAAIANAKWDYVVLQEQSQIPSFPNAVRTMAGPVGELGKRAADAGAELLLFETWGRRDGDVRNVEGDTFAAMQKRLTAGYAKVAESSGGRVVPVGTVWSTVKQPNGLWGRDGSHPSTAGTYLSACVFYAAVFGESPEGSRYTGGLRGAQVRVLQRAAGGILEREEEE